MAELKGIDVSDNQGYIDWAKVKADGVQFAILRSTRGSGNPDKQLASNIKGCLSVGMPMDFYKYRYGNTEAKTRSEAKKVIDTLISLGVKPSKNTVIWDDVEDDCMTNLSKSQLTKLCNIFREGIEKAGFGYGLYMGMYDYNNEINGKEIKDDCWVARYYNGYNVMDFSQNPNEKYKPKVADGSKLWGWQYTSSGRVDGIKGNVDLDIAYYDIKETEVAPEYYETPEFTLIDSLNKIGADSSYQGRKWIAQKNGIVNYKGTAEQNLKMLDLLNSGKLIKP